MSRFAEKWSRKQPNLATRTTLILTAYQVTNYGTSRTAAIGPAARMLAKRKKYERGPDTVAIGLPDGKTYVFELRRYGSFPKALHQLIEDPNKTKPDKK